jgi:hypothetical protein
MKIWKEEITTSRMVMGTTLDRSSDTTTTGTMRTIQTILMTRGGSIDVITSTDSSPSMVSILSTDSRHRVASHTSTDTRHSTDRLVTGSQICQVLSENIYRDLCRTKMTGIRPTNLISLLSVFIRLISRLYP